MIQKQRDFGKQSIHDLVIGILKQRWMDTTKYNIDTNPGSEKNRWVGSEQNKQYPDLIAWAREFNRDRARWIAEVETEESVTVSEASGQWTGYAKLGLPFYLVVPIGYKRSAEMLAGTAGIKVARVYEYWFADNRLQIA
jgi:hypothetical protein